MEFDGPDGYDPDKIVDEESEKQMMEQLQKMQIEGAGKNKPYLENVLALVQEAADKSII